VPLQEQADTTDPHLRPAIAAPANAGPQQRPDPLRILQSIGEAVYDWDMVSDRLTWGDNVQSVLDVDDPAAIATGNLYAELLSPHTRSSRYTAVHNSTGVDDGQGVPFQAVYGLTTRGRNLIWVEDNGRWFAGADGKPGRVHGVVRVVTERYEETQRLAYQSRFDPLTGTLNRQALLDEVARRFTGATPKNPFSVLLLAIENLAVVNRSYGYEVADALIVGVVKRLREQLRGIDVIARYTGNKFAVILDACEGGHMEATARRLLKSVSCAPIVTSGGDVQASLRIGGVMDPRFARSPETLMKRAEEALDLTRENASRRFAAYDPSVVRDDARVRTAQVAADIVSALNGRRVFLACQPIVASSDRAPALYEALVRIEREDGTIVMPSAILPVAEKVGLIQLIDHRVLELALARLDESPSLTLAINVSAATALDLDWSSRVAQALALHPGAAERLIIELTETRAIEDIAATGRIIAELKALGVRVAMDDFGAGHTSFKNLRSLDVDLLKIDGAFIQNLARSADDRFFAHTLVKLARHVGIPVVAEWVEDVESARILTEWGVDYLQGHYFGRAGPLAPAALQGPQAEAV
jgi:diguanylate cyclase (GGDEF)-like protein